MKFCKIILVAASVFVLGACSTPQEITYFQDLRPGESELALVSPTEIKIMPKDKLSILVNSQDLRLTNLFNLPIVSQQIGMETPSGMTRGLSGYTVDSKGNIDFPVLGAIHIEGMTREEVAAHIKKELQSHDLIKEPVVTVEFMNLTVSVMGEVNKPGRYNIEKDHVTVLDALSQAGDLTITASGTKCWSCGLKKANSVSMGWISGRQAISILPPFTICNRTMSFMWSPMIQRHANRRSTGTMSAAPRSGCHLPPY